MITARDDIMNYMLDLGVDRENAYKIMDTVRKGRALRPEQIELMPVNAGDALFPIFTKATRFGQMRGWIIQR